MGKDKNINRMDRISRIKKKLTGMKGIKGIRMQRIRGIDQVLLLAGYSLYPLHSFHPCNLIVRTQINAENADKSYELLICVISLDLRLISSTTSEARLIGRLLWCRA